MAGSKVVKMKPEPRQPGRCTAYLIVRAATDVKGQYVLLAAEPLLREVQFCGSDNVVLPTVVYQPAWFAQGNKEDILRKAQDWKARWTRSGKFLRVCVVVEQED